MDDIQFCTACRHPTKRPVGTWTGDDPKTGAATGGFLFDCKNRHCPIFKRRQAAKLAAAKREAETAEENQRNGVNPEAFLELRRKCRITIGRAAHMAGVSPATLCNWEMGREPFPVGLYLMLCQQMKVQLRRESGEMP